MHEGDSLADAQRDFFLEVYRSAVDVYKPKIEKKTGVELGDIAVWDFSYFHEHARQHISGPWLDRTIRRLIFRRQFRAQSDIAKAYYDELATKCSAAYLSNGIYVSFSSGTAHEEAIAATVVHELSHALWERLGKRPLTWYPKAKYMEKYRLFGEGFATYAEKVWFLDLYPVSVRQSVQRVQWDPQSVHYKGFQRIQELVKQFGPDILPQIPRRWKSLE